MWSPPRIPSLPSLPLAKLQKTLRHTYIPKKILSATARRGSVPESRRPVTRKTRVKTSPAQTDDPMRATEGGETQAAAAAATSTTEATEEKEEEATTPLIIICSVPSRYYYTHHHHHHHHRRTGDFLVSQFRWLLPMRAKHGKTTNLKK
jgi:hypothetical protein